MRAELKAGRKRRSGKRGWIGWGFLLLLGLLWPFMRLEAHPFGARYLAHLTVLKVSPDRIQLDYMVEVPTTLIMREFYQALRGREPSKEEDARFTQLKLGQFVEGLKLSVNGQPLVWTNRTDPAMRNGIGNMNFFTYKLQLEASWMPEVGSVQTLTLENRNYLDYDPIDTGERPVDPRDRGRLEEGGSYFSPQLWVSDALKVQDYSAWQRMQSGASLDVSGAWWNEPRLRTQTIQLQVLAPAGNAPVVVPLPGRAMQADPVQMETDKSPYQPGLAGVPLLNYLKDAPQEPWLVLTALLAAAFFGAAHALSPGHGKALVAAYLVGSRGTLRHALWLGLSVTVAHTSSVIVLGLVTLFASEFILPETLAPYLGLVSGVGIVWIGCVLLWDRWKMRHQGLVERQSAALAQVTEAQPGAHSHWRAGDETPHAHLELVPEEISVKQLLKLGTVGGIIPCPTATVVLLTAIALNKVLFGLGLVLAFSVGLAAVLVGIGMVLVLAGGYFSRFTGSHGLLRYLPVLSALVVVVLGVWVSAEALQGLVQGGRLPVSASSTE